MDEICCYTIEVQGRVDAEGINRKSPISIHLLRADRDSTRFTITTDQSGFIGFLRHLHARGFVLLLTTCQRETDEQEKLCLP